ncbi:hypothetical protein Tco_1224303 [Tanacetum coccineum]
MDFMILDIKEDVKKPLILRTTFLTMARAEIKFDKGTISLRSRKSTVQFHISPDPFPTLKERDENKINTLSVVNKRVLEWEEKIKFHHTKELEFKAWKSKYSKIKALAPKDVSGSGTSESHRGVTPTIKNKGLIAKAYEWDKEEVSSDDNEMVEVKVLMTLAEENDAISKEGTKNCKWVKISMRKLHTLLEMEDNDDRKPIYIICVILNKEKSGSS